MCQTTIKHQYFFPVRWAAEFRNYDIYIYKLHIYIYTHMYSRRGGVRYPWLKMFQKDPLYFEWSPNSSRFFYTLYIYNIQIFQHLRDIPGTFQRAPQPKHLREQAQCSLPGARPTAGGQTGGATDGVRLEADPGNIQQQMMDLLQQCGAPRVMFVGL